MFVVETKEELWMPFAIDECLLKKSVSQPILHFWQTPDCVILGMTDTKLPYLDKAIECIRRRQHEVVLRSAGGLAVVSDDGVLNVSLIFTKEELSIKEAYQQMMDLVAKAFPEKMIEAYEVSDSYCPGEYDLSIDGKKFAGLAQRRFKDTIIVAMYLSVNGLQQERGKLVRDMYTKGLKQEKTKWHFPVVNPDSMANLSELLHQELTVEDVKERLLQVLLNAECTLVDCIVEEEFEQEYEQAYQAILHRQKRLSKKG